MPRNILRYCIHTIQLIRGPVGPAGVGVDRYGEPLEAATPETLALNARVEWDNRRVLGMNGEEKVAAAYVFIPKRYYDGTGVEVELSIGIQDLIVFEGRQHPIIKIDRQEGWRADRGEHYGVWIL